MTRPGPQSASAASRAGSFPSSLAGAVDLAALKERAAQKASPTQQNSARPAPGDGPSLITDVTEQTFESEVIERSNRVLVVVDLWATWAEPCKELSPILEQLASEANGKWVLARIDVDANPRIAQAFGVQSVPTVVAIAGGQPVHAFAGMQSEPQIRQWLGELLKAVEGKLPGEARQDADAVAEPPRDPRIEAAEDALQNGDFAAAEAAYAQILNDEPRNTEAKAGANHARFLARVQNLSPEAAKIADTNPDDIDAQLDAADFEVVNREPEAAFGRLIGLIRSTAGDDRSRVRERLISLLDLFDPADPLVLAARRDLAAALY
ncbi:tetratricopeptide repeat protein [Hoyosella subflava]|uniref:Putative thioredoxin n=1 Tax=Hoyosella subflava (strain DSM 45089 / JCM 17490 / NBRC 109087 / DQS3-9A1) TaxID=443218 RepID=F6ENL1_HOYSD|nr:tetratricopeptide repeat protein [Hoyosella subflava]AEF41680.1 Putative thioredoxin [Hoyosella subflava DQS3-9A1]